MFKGVGVEVETRKKLEGIRKDIDAVKQQPYTWT
jgi:hypothetical protein